MEATTEPKRKATVGVALDVMKAAREEGEERLARLEKLVRATNYLAAAQIYLKDNVLLSEPLKREHLKERLLGHWGTCPGLNLVYAHASNLIKKHDLDMFLVVGPGHGAPSYLANIWAEGSLGKFYPDYCNNWHGLKNLISKFSWPEGFPSHVNSEMPGCIHEGGELGYALAVSFGAIMDNSDLIVACVIGDGESETGPTATAWHSYKFIDPKESGAVLPILHLNHFKIASATIYGSMTYEELNSLFTGYGYEVRFVSDLKNIHADLCASMEWAYKRIRHIQQAARQGNPIERPYWPMLVLDTPKGFTGVKELDGKKIEGNYLSHQVPVDPFSSDKAFSAVEQWLKSYQVHELFDLETGSLIKELRECFPRKERRMGMNPHTMPRFKPLDLPPLEKYACTLEGDEEEKGKDRQNEPNEKKRGKHSCGLMQQLGKYLAGVIERNPTRFRIFSPDELVSNKLEGVFEVTNRNTQWWHGLGQGETKKRDTARVIEMLSEHTCQGWMQGYCLTGRFALFPSYETFLGIITTMMMQYAKFIKLGLQTSWRPPTPSLNYIETSTLWRQEHNGFSHQNPMFSSNLINMRTQLVRVFFPPDANCCLWCMEYCLSHHNTINLVVGTKKEMPLFFDMEEARARCTAGASVWEWMSTDDGINPDVVLVGCGNETNNEVVAACCLLRKDCPQLRFRMVNVIDLLVLDRNRELPHALDDEEFDSLFTKDKPVIFNYHGYPSTVHTLLFGRDTQRFQVSGYIEEGTTTTPFDMLAVNKCSRYHIAIKALKAAARQNESVAIASRLLIAEYKLRLQEHKKYIVQHGKDPEYLGDMLKEATSS